MRKIITSLGKNAKLENWERQQFLESEVLKKPRGVSFHLGVNAMGYSTSTNPSENKQVGAEIISGL